MKTITKSIGMGFAHNPIYAALAYDATDHFGGYQIKDIMHNTTYKTYYYDTNAYIYSSTSTQLDLVATTIAVTGNLTVSGSLTYGSVAVTLAQDIQATLTVGVNDTGYDVKFYGAGTGKYWLWDENVDTNGGVVLVGTFAQTGNMAITGTFSVSSTSTLTGNVTLAGDLTSGTSDDGNDVTFYGDAGSGAWKWVFDQDTNGGVLLVGSFLQTGNMTLTGTLTVGVNNTGHDVKFFGATASKYWLWDENVDTMIVVGPTNLTGAVSITGAVGITGDVTMATSDQINFYDTTQYIKASSGTQLDIVGPTIAFDCTAMTSNGTLTITPATNGTFLDFVVDGWGYGTLINADFGVAETLTDDTIGMLLEFNGNVTMTTDKDVTGYQILLPALTQSANNTTTIIGFDLPTAGALNQSAAGAIVWKGFNIQLPNQQEATGTATSYGIYIIAGTVTSGNQYGIYFPAGTLTTAIDLAGTATNGISFSGTCSTAGIVFSGTATEAAISIGGTYDHGIYFTEDPAAGDVTNSFINIGNYTTAIAVTPTSANMFGVMHNVAVSANVAYWYQAYYTKITTSGTTTSTSIAGHALRINIATDIEAAYGIQCHTNITAGANVTQEVISVSAMVDLGTGATTSDRVCALQAMITGSGTAGTVVGDAIVAYLVNGGTVVTTDAICKIYNQSAATATIGLHIDNDGTMTDIMKIDGSATYLLNLDDASTFISSGGTDCTASGATDPAYTIKIKDPAGAAGYIRVWAAA